MSGEGALRRSDGCGETEGCSPEEWRREWGMESRPE